MQDAYFSRWGCPANKFNSPVEQGMRICSGYSTSGGKGKNTETGEGSRYAYERSVQHSEKDQRTGTDDLGKIGFSKGKWSRKSLQDSNDDVAGESILQIGYLGKCLGDYSGNGEKENGNVNVPTKTGKLEFEHNKTCFGGSDSQLSRVDSVKIKVPCEPGYIKLSGYSAYTYGKSALNKSGSF